MPSESRSIPKMIGLENEYGCMGDNLPEEFSAETAGTTFISKMKPQWFSFEKSGAWDPTERLLNIDADDEKRHAHLKDKDWHLMNFLMPNGARLYCDMTHPEICIPICRNAKEALLHDRACEWLMNFIRKKHMEEYGHKYLLYKNNTARGYEDDSLRRGGGVSYATHENYLVSRSVPLEDLYPKVLPFLVIRTVLIGAGMIGSQRRDSEIKFQISQRAEYFGQSYGVDTTGYSRPIYNLRDRPYADPQRFRRIHVISGDANMCEMAEFLKFSTMQVLLMMIEDEYLDKRFDLTDPVESFHKISKDVNFKELLEMKGEKKSRTAIDLCKEYIGLMGEYLEEYSISDPILHLGINEAQRVINLLASTPELLFGEIDHITKKMLIEKALEKGKISSWRDPNAKTMDMKYHNINPAESLFYKPKTYQLMKRLVTDEEIRKAVFEPPPTRSRFQVEVHKRFGLLLWDWQKICIADENGDISPMIFLEDPAIPWEKLKELLCDDRKEFLKLVKNAGFMKGPQYNANPDEAFHRSYPKNTPRHISRHKHYSWPNSGQENGPVQKEGGMLWWKEFSYKEILDELKKRGLTDDD
ncbi:MAG: hypothetical protein A3D41_03900 [Candidatus Sungbacteria bacterium RIFCSPHIGHO2_02_FULL_41_12b]|nr:MAG: hypothetical protein A3D41_03900 [Candidatus Sungbacteria bacterium RIFCSPHIGHO2_02_FULL_41_12b]